MARHIATKASRQQRIARRLASRRLRRALVETLERREMLAGDTLQYKTGDLTVLSVSQLVNTSGQTLAYQLPKVTLTSLDQPLPLSLSRIEQSSVYSVGSPGGEVARLVLDNQFAQNGIFAIAPGTDPALLTTDIDPARPGIQSVDASGQPGWQGRLRFEFLVGGQQLQKEIEVQNGFIPINSTSLDRPALLRAVQQRLNYLGFDGGAGQALPLSGTEDAATQLALAQFKAAIDSSGEQTPAGEAPTDTNPALDSRTWRWLNDANAPRWIKLPAPPNSLTPYNGRPFVTSWVVNSLQMAGRDPLLAQNLQMINTASGTPRKDHSHQIAGDRIKPAWMSN